MRSTSLRQKDQIKSSSNFNDSIENIDPEIYSPESLEDDLNLIRTQIKNIIGEDSWYSPPKTSLKTFLAKNNFKWNFIKGNDPDQKIEPDKVLDSISFTGQSGVETYIENDKVYIKNTLPYFKFYEDSVGNQTSSSGDNSVFEFVQGSDITLTITDSPQNELKIEYDGPELTGFFSWLNIESQDGTITATERKDKLYIISDTIDLSFSGTRITAAAQQDLSTDADIEIKYLSLILDDEINMSDNALVFSSETNKVSSTGFLSWDNQEKNLFIGAEIEETDNTLNVFRKDFRQEFKENPYRIKQNEEDQTEVVIDSAIVGECLILLLDNKILKYTIYNEKELNIEIVFQKNTGKTNCKKLKTHNNYCFFVGSDDNICFFDSRISLNSVYTYNIDKFDSTLSSNVIVDYDIDGGHLYFITDNSAQSVYKIDISNPKNMFLEKKVDLQSEDIVLMSSLILGKNEVFLPATVSGPTERTISLKKEDLSVYKTSDYEPITNDVLLDISSNYILSHNSNSGTDPYLYLYNYNGDDITEFLSYGTETLSFRKGKILGNYIIMLNSSDNKIYIYLIKENNSAISLISDLDPTGSGINDFCINGRDIYIFTEIGIKIYNLDSFLTEHYSSDSIMSYDFYNKENIISFGKNRANSLNLYGNLEVSESTLSVFRNTLKTTNDFHLGASKKFDDYEISEGSIEQKNTILEEVVRFEVDLEVKSIVVDENYAFVSSKNYFSIYNIYDINNPVLISSNPIQYSGEDLVKVKNYVYQKTDTILYIWDIKEIGNVQKIEIEYTGDFSHIALSDMFLNYSNYLFFSSNSSENQLSGLTFSCYKIKENTIEFVKTLYQGRSLGLFVLDNTLYVYRGGESSIWTYSVNNIDEDITEDFLQTTGFTENVGSFLVKGCNIFCTIPSESKFLCYKIDPIGLSSTVLLSEIEDPIFSGEKTKIRLLNNLAFVSCDGDLSGGGFSAVDISDTNNLSIIEKIESNGVDGAEKTYDFYLHKNKIYITNFNTGEISVYQYNEAKIYDLKSGNINSDYINIEKLNISNGSYLESLYTDNLFLDTETKTIVERSFNSGRLFVGKEYDNKETNISMHVSGKDFSLGVSQENFDYKTYSISFGTITKLKTYNNKIYMLESNKVKTIDLEKDLSSNLVIKDTITIPSIVNVIDIDFSGEYCYAVSTISSVGRLSIIRAENNILPVLVSGYVSLPSPPKFIKTIGQYLIIGFTNNTAKHIYNISNPETPTLVSNDSYSDLAYSSFIEKMGSLLFFANDGSRTDIVIKRNNINSFGNISYFEYPNRTGKVQMKIIGDDIFILSATHFTRVKLSKVVGSDTVLSLSDTDKYSQINTGGQEFYILNNYVFIKSSANIVCYDISHDINMTEVSTFTISGLAANSKSIIYGNKIIILSSNKVEIVKISQIKTPTFYSKEARVSNINVYENVSSGNFYSDSLSLGPVGLFVDDGEGLFSDGDVSVAKNSFFGNTPNELENIMNGLDDVLVRKQGFIFFGDKAKKQNNTKTKSTKITTQNVYGEFEDIYYNNNLLTLPVKSDSGNLTGIQYFSFYNSSLDSTGINNALKSFSKISINSNILFGYIDNKIEIYKLGSNNRPEILLSEISFSSPEDIKSYNEYLFVLKSGELSVYDVSNPEYPAFYKNFTSVGNFFFNDNVLYLSGFSSNSLSLSVVSMKDMLVKNEFTIPSVKYQIIGFYGNKIYYIKLDGKLSSIQINNPYECIYSSTDVSSSDLIVSETDIKQISIDQSYVFVLFGKKIYSFSNLKYNILDHIETINIEDNFGPTLYSYKKIKRIQNSVVVISNKKNEFFLFEYGKMKFNALKSSSIESDYLDSEITNVVGKFTSNRLTVSNGSLSSSNDMIVKKNIKSNKMYFGKIEDEHKEYDFSISNLGIKHETSLTPQINSSLKSGYNLNDIVIQDGSIYGTTRTGNKIVKFTIKNNEIEFDKEIVFTQYGGALNSASVVCNKNYVFIFNQNETMVFDLELNFIVEIENEDFINTKKIMFSGNKAYLITSNDKVVIYDISELNDFTTIFDEQYSTLNETNETSIDLFVSSNKLYVLYENSVSQEIIVKSFVNNKNFLEKNVAQIVKSATETPVSIYVKEGILCLLTDSSVYIYDINRTVDELEPDGELFSDTIDFGKKVEIIGEKMYVFVYSNPISELYVYDVSELYSVELLETVDIRGSIGSAHIDIQDYCHYQNNFYFWDKNSLSVSDFIDIFSIKFSDIRLENIENQFTNTDYMTVFNKIVGKSNIEVGGNLEAKSAQIQNEIVANIVKFDTTLGSRKYGQIPSSIDLSSVGLVGLFNYNVPIIQEKSFKLNEIENQVLSDIVVVGKYLFASYYWSDSISYFEISDTENVKFISTIESFEAHKMRTNGKEIIISDLKTGKISKLSINHLSEFEPQDIYQVYPIPEPVTATYSSEYGLINDIQVQGDIVYGIGSEGFFILNLTDSSVGEFTLDADNIRPRELKIYNNKAYITSSIEIGEIIKPSGIEILDLESANQVAIFSFDEDIENHQAGWSFSKMGNIGYIADSLSGYISVLDFSNENGEIANERIKLIKSFTNIETGMNKIDKIEIVENYIIAMSKTENIIKILKIVDKENIYPICKIKSPKENYNITGFYLEKNKIFVLFDKSNGVTFDNFIGIYDTTGISIDILKTKDLFITNKISIENYLQSIGNSFFDGSICVGNEGILCKSMSSSNGYGGQKFARLSLNANTTAESLSDSNGFEYYPSDLVTHTESSIGNLNVTAGSSNSIQGFVSGVYEICLSLSIYDADYGTDNTKPLRMVFSLRKNDTETYSISVDMKNRTKFDEVFRCYIDVDKSTDEIMSKILFLPQDSSVATTNYKFKISTNTNLEIKKI